MFILIIFLQIFGSESFTSQSNTQIKINHHCNAIQLDQSILDKGQRAGGNYHTDMWMKYWDPSWSCQLDQKFGKFANGWKDGAKWVCNSHLIKQGDCLVYSFGSLGEFDFEIDVSKKLQCEIHIFDPFNMGPYMSTDHLPNHPEVFLHPIGLTEKSHNFTLNNRTVVMKSLDDIIVSLGHVGRVIDLLKVDIEGCEFGVMDDPNMWAKINPLVEIDQILIEVHALGINRQNYKFRPPQLYSAFQVDNLFRVLHAEGFAIFHKEVNALVKASHGCSEFSLVKLDIDCEGKKSKSKKPSKYLV